LSDEVLVTLSPTGVVHHDGERWRVLSGDVVVTRGHDDVEL
jgi:mannose-6-phosphate isomerase-like protein (cupin superfamily)